MKLSVIIPVFNEEKTVREIIRKVKKVKFQKEIIVIDDGSTDKTPKILQGIRNIQVFSHKTNLGKGAAVRTGIKKAIGDIILIQDADLEYNPKDYERLIKPIADGKAKVVYGSRLKNYPLVLLGKGKTPMPLHLIANRVLTLLTNILYRSELTDMETCYKVFTKAVAREIELFSNGFEIEPELTAKILKKGYKIYEVPIKVKPRGYKDGKKINWKDGVRAVYYLFYFRFFDR